MKKTINISTTNLSRFYKKVLYNRSSLILRFVARENVAITVIYDCKRTLHSIVQKLFLHQKVIAADTCNKLQAQKNKDNKAKDKRYNFKRLIQMVDKFTLGTLPFHYRHFLR